MTERFKNPFIDHALLSISLNSTSKWRARILPSLEKYIEKFGKLPACLTVSFAFYILFYRGQERTADGLTAARPDGTIYTISDDPAVLDFFYAHKNAPIETLVHALCANSSFWGKDLTALPGFESEVIRILKNIETTGIYEQMRTLCR